jgi:hypothetical protein
LRCANKAEIKNIFLCFIRAFYATKITAQEKCFSLAIIKPYRVIWPKRDIELKEAFMCLYVFHRPR